MIITSDEETVSPPVNEFAGFDSAIKLVEVMPPLPLICPANVRGNELALVVNVAFPANTMLLANTISPELTVGLAELSSTVVPLFNVSGPIPIGLLTTLPALLRADPAAIASVALPKMDVPPEYVL